MKTTPDTALPRIEALLSAAHRNFDAIRERCRAIERSGIGQSHLPDELELMAFALLGDHERDKPLEQVRAHWLELQSKGLAHGAIDEATTAELRLLNHALPFTQAIDNVWQRLRDAGHVPEPPHGILLCPRQVRGQWGQLARIHFVAQDVRHMLIAPDKAFESQSAFIAVEPNGKRMGAFAIPIDNGEITITLLHRSGDVFRHVIQVMVKEAA